MSQEALSCIFPQTLGAEGLIICDQQDELLLQLMILIFFLVLASSVDFYFSFHLTLFLYSFLLLQSVCYSLPDPLKLKVLSGVKMLKYRPRTVVLGHTQRFVF